MNRKTPADFAPQVLRLFDQYVHGLITRQDFLRDAAPFAPPGSSAETLLEDLNPRFAEACQVAPDDARIRARMLEYPSPRCHGKVGVTGFCYGGRIANFLATRVPDLGAAVSFYGAEPPLTDVPQIQAPLQIHLADKDERINTGWPAYQAALEAARIAYEIHHYPGTEHGFNNNTTPRFDPRAAALAWGRTLDFQRQHLG